MCKVYCEKRLLKFQKFCWSLFLIKKGLKACNFIKKRLRHRCFPVKFLKFLRTSILKNIYEQLLLSVQQRLNSGTAQAKILFAECQRVAMERMTDNIPAGNKPLRLSSVNHFSEYCI